MIRKIEQLMKYDTAGDPVSGVKWTRRTTRKIAQELMSLGIQVSRGTVSRLLKAMDFSLRVNHKRISRGSSNCRDQQFVYLASLRSRFAKRDDPIISVDTKKKELIGLFKNAGTAWARQSIAVNDHDFRSDAVGIAVPYGVYDVQDNSAAVFVGTSYNTPEFAVASVRRWWTSQGRHRYPRARRLLVLADNGGGNGAKCRAWKYFLQTELCDRFGMSVTVCHYPPGTSKWNPIEHRLFSEISKNWNGRPLDSYETCLNYIGTTRTSTGLKVRAHLDTRHYEKGIKIPHEHMRLLRLKQHTTLPQWNYTLRSRLA